LSSFAGNKDLSAAFYPEGGKRDFLARQFVLIVAALLAIQALLWIVAPLFFEGSIRLDVAEGAIDGPEWQLSYLRHPPLSSWLSGLASQAGPFRYAAVYAIGWALASGAFAIVAFFLRRVDRAESGLAALVIGLVSPFATYVPLQINHNITLMFFWAATLATAWSAFETGTLLAWILFGATVGLGLWAKYAILLLAGPLGLVLLLVPAWRARLLSTGPWVAAAIAIILAAPHFIDVLHKGGTTLDFASRVTPATFLVRLGWVGESLLHCLLANAFMCLVAGLIVGFGRLRAAAGAMARPATATRLDWFLAASAIAPVLIVLLAAPWGKRPHYLWMTPFNVSFAALWGRAVSRALAWDDRSARRLLPVYAVFAFLAALGYAAIAEIVPHMLKRPRYVDMDGPALARLAQDYWAQHESGAIPLIVSYGDDRKWPGMQAAGSIVFDMPYRVRALVEADPSMSTWIDVKTLRRRDALVVSVKELHEGDAFLGTPVAQVARFDRPTLRGAKTEPIYFAILPASP
jgi:4-amino-4-deoxy-L-arabinose transferase-like glycosyltransferase